MCKGIGFPIEEVYDLIFPEEMNVHGHLAMVYHAFLDDSSDRTKSKVVVSASFIGDKKQWSSLRVLWNKRLKEAGLKYFKASEYYGLRGEFLKFKSPNKYPAPTGRIAAKKVLTDLEGIIRRVGIDGLGIVIPIAVFDEVASPPEAHGKAWREPYHLALQSLFLETVKVIRKRPGRHVVAFAHDDGSNFPTLYEVYLDFRRKNPRTAKLMGGFAPLDDKSHPPLQAADLVANLTTNLALKWLQNPSRTTLDRLRESILKIAVWDKAYMRAVLKEQRGKSVP